jgi:hypothetical protein
VDAVMLPLAALALVDLAERLKVLLWGRGPRRSLKTAKHRAETLPRRWKREGEWH